jgi:hypothetical protein
VGDTAGRGGPAPPATIYGGALGELVALAVAAVVDPPVGGGSRVVGVGLGLWLCLAGSLALLAAAMLALRRSAPVL